MLNPNPNNIKQSLKFQSVSWSKPRKTQFSIQNSEKIPVFFFVWKSSGNLAPGFIGTDRLQLFVQGLRPQAAAAATEPPRAELGMAIQVPETGGFSMESLQSGAP